MDPDIRAWILVGHEAVPVENFMQWAQWFECATQDGSRFIKRDEVGPYRVSTVFIGLEGDLFETMIFGVGALDEYQERCDTYEQALQQHERAMNVAREALKE